MKKSKVIGVLLALSLASQNLAVPVYANVYPDVSDESQSGNEISLEQTLPDDLESLENSTVLSNNHFYVPEEEIGAQSIQAPISPFAANYVCWADKTQVKQGDYFNVYTNVPYNVSGFGFNTYSNTKSMAYSSTFDKDENGNYMIRFRAISPITFEIIPFYQLASSNWTENKLNGITISVSPLNNFTPRIYPGSDMVLKPGDTDKLSTNIFEGLSSLDGRPDFSISGVVWTSSNPDIVQIENFSYNQHENAGKIKAISPGTARIYVKSLCESYVVYKDITVVAPEVIPTGISINAPQTSINVGETLQLSGTITPNNATNKEIEWTVDSSSTSIATVSSNGLVTGKGVGTARIKATALGNKSITAYKDITVNSAEKPVTNVSLNKTSIQLSINQTEILTCDIAPTDATNKTLTWKSSNTNVATVSQNGLITAVGTGTAHITVTSHNGKSSTCQVDVISNNIPVQSLALDPSTITLEVDQDYNLIPIFSPSNATNQSIKWSVTNSNIVKCVDGKLTAVSVGTTSVTATSVDGNKRGRCVVTVVPAVKTIPATDISISSTYESVVVGDKVELSYQLFPSDATDSVRWKIFDGDEEIISNDGNGVFTALKEGFATVYVESIENSDIVAYCDIEVLSDKIPATEIRLSSNYEEISIGESINLSYELTPSDSTEKITWGVFDDESESIVSCDGNGKFTGLAGGFATVYAVSESNGEIIDYCDIYVTE